MLGKKVLSYILSICMIVSLFTGVNLVKKVETVEAATELRVVGYLPSYREYAFGSIDYSALTHCILSFMTYNNGTLTPGFSDGSVSDIVNRCHQNGTKVMIAIGGWDGFITYSDPFGDAGQRANTINTIVDYVNRLNLDGVDLDIELAEGYVWANFETFARELSGRLKSNGKLLTMAVGTWFTGSVPNGAYQYFDFLNLMSYDANQTGTGDHAPMSQIYDMIGYYNARGVSNDRLVIGVPFYGYGPGGAVTYAEMVARNPAYADMDVADGVFYNGRNTIRQKAEFSKGYGGTMIWEIAQDSFGQYSLLSVIKSVIPRGSSSSGGGGSQQTQPTQSQQPPNGYTTCTQNQNTNVGQWNYYFGDWAGASGFYKGGNALDNFSLKINSNGKGEWGIQAFTNEISVENGATYRYRINVNSDKGAGEVLLKNDATTDAYPHGVDLVKKGLGAGDNVFEGTFAAYTNNVKFMFDLTNIDAGTTLNFNSFTLEKVGGSQQEQTQPTDPPKETTTVKVDSNVDYDSVGWLGDGTTEGTFGNTFKAVIASDGGVSEVVNIQNKNGVVGIYVTLTDASYGDIAINGVKKNQFAVGAGIWINVEDLTKRDNEVIFYNPDGSIKGVVRIMNAKRNDDGSVVTTEAPTEASTEPQQTDPQQQPTESQTDPSQQTTGKDSADVNYDDAKWLGDGARAGALANTFKAVIVSGGITGVVNIQDKKGVAGIYVTLTDANFGDIAINGEKKEQIIEGAGVWINVEDLTKRDNEVIFYNSDGSVKGVLRILNASVNDDGSQTTTVAPTESQPTSDSQQPSDQQPTDDSQQPSDQQPTDDSQQSSDQQSTDDSQQPGDQQSTGDSSDEPTTKDSSYQWEFDPSTLDYQTYKCDGNKELTIDVAIHSAEVEGLTLWYGDNGKTLLFQYSSICGTATDVTINGQPAGEGVVTENTAGGIKLDPTAFPEDAYTIIRVVAEQGEFTVVVRKGNPEAPQLTTTEQQPDDSQQTEESKQPDDPQQTGESQQPDDSQTTGDAQTEEPTEKTDVNYDDANWLLDGAKEGALDNIFKAVIVSGGINEVVNIQNKEGIAGIYVTLTDADFGDIIINGEKKDQISEGAGVWINVEDLTERDNEVIFYNPDGSIKGVLRILNASISDGESQDTTAEQGDSQTGDSQQTDNPSGEETTKASFEGDFDPSTLNYETYICDGNEALSIDAAIYSAEVEGLTLWYGDNGKTLLFQYSSICGIATDVIINGQPAGEGVVTENTAGGIKVDPTTFPEDAYTIVKIATEQGEFTVVIRKGNPESPQPTTTEQQPDDPQQTGESQQPDDPQQTEESQQLDTTKPEEQTTVETEETTDAQIGDQQSTEDPTNAPTGNQQSTEGPTDTSTGNQQSTDAPSVTTTPALITTTPALITTTAGSGVTTAPENGTTTVSGGVTTAPGNGTTAGGGVTTPKPPVKVTAPGKAKIKKVVKKQSAKKVTVTLKKPNAKGYQVAVYQTKKNAKKNKKALVQKIVKKKKATIKSKKLMNKEILFVRVRAYNLNGATKLYGKWSTVKKVRIK